MCDGMPNARCNLFGVWLAFVIANVVIVHVYSVKIVFLATNRLIVRPISWIRPWVIE